MDTKDTFRDLTHVEGPSVSTGGLLNRPFGTITKRHESFTVTLDKGKLLEKGVIEEVDGEAQLVDEDIEVTKTWDEQRHGFFIGLPEDTGENATD